MQQHYVTTWENPTKHLQIFELHHGPGAAPDRFEVKPGDTVEVLGKYDDAIRTVRDGIVVGGLAPLLVPKGRKDVPVHESIARAAHLGDVERKVVAATGTSAGSASLDAVMALEAKNAELEAKLNDLMASMAERGAPPAAAKPTSREPPKGQQQPQLPPSAQG